MAVTNMLSTPLITLCRDFIWREHTLPWNCTITGPGLFPNENTVWWQQDKEKLRGLMLHKHADTATGYENRKISELISLLSFMLNFIFQISSHSKNFCFVEAFLKWSTSGSLIQYFLLLWKACCLSCKVPLLPLAFPFCISLFFTRNSLRVF